MIEILFIISFAAFVVSALAWFTFWAIWIHAPVAAHGPAPSTQVAAILNEPVDPSVQRRLEWYRRLKRTTLALLAVVVALGVAALL